MKTIVITGANSGIGKALSLAYAKQGCNLLLLARTEQSLAQTAKECQQLGKGHVEYQALDVCDREKAAKAIHQFDQQYAIDGVIANAGIASRNDKSFEKSRQILATNIDGVLNTIHPAIDCFKPRQGGHVVIMSSLASFIGLPGSSAYTASKAAVRLYGESMRAALAHDKIGLTVICPGFIDTPMTQGRGLNKLFFIPMNKAVNIMQKGIAKNKPRVAFPRRLYWPILLSTVLPRMLYDKIIFRFAVPF